MSIPMTFIVYPLPLDSWEIFRPDVERFCETFQKFPPGADCTLAAMCCSRWPTGEEMEIFRQLPVKVEFFRYDGKGYDIGAHQHFAFQAGNAFCVNVSTRVYFHREGWLKKMLESRDYFGPGLFGTAVSREVGYKVSFDRLRIHFRTHCYGIEASELRDYPLLINTRERGFMLEHGACDNPEGTFLEWCSRRPQNAIACVFWDGAWRPNEWFDRPNQFRMGDQSNLLVFDKHTLIFEKETKEEREFLTNNTYNNHP